MSTGVIVLLVVIIIFIVAPLGLFLVARHSMGELAKDFKSAGCCVSADGTQMIIGSGPAGHCPSWAPKWQAGSCPSTPVRA